MTAPFGKPVQKIGEVSGERLNRYVGEQGTKAGA
jgi:hypothetical protein